MKAVQLFAAYYVLHAETTLTYAPSVEAAREGCTKPFPRDLTISRRRRRLTCLVGG